MLHETFLDCLLEEVKTTSGKLWEPINTDWLDGYTEFELCLDKICPPNWTEVISKLLKQLNSEYVNPLERFHHPDA